MAEKQPGINFTVIKSKDENPLPSPIVSPGKSIRNRRSMKRREEVQSALQVLISEGKESGNRSELLATDKNHKNSQSFPVDKKNKKKQKGTKASDKQSVVNKDGLDKNVVDNDNNKKNIRKGKSKAHEDDSGTKRNVDDTERESELSTNFGIDSDIKTNLHHSVHLEDSFKTPGKSCGSEQRANALSLDSGIIKASKLGSDSNEKLTKIQTPTNKRKGRPPRKISTNIEITPTVTAIDTEKSRLQDDSFNNFETVNDIVASSPNVLTIQTDTNINDISAKSNDKTMKPKRKSRLPKKLSPDVFNSSLDDSTSSSHFDKLQRGDNVTSHLETVVDNRVTETPSDQILKPKRKGRPPRNLSLDAFNSSLNDSVSDSPSDQRNKYMKAEHKVTESTPMSSRKRKRIDYSALNRGDDDNDDDIIDKSKTLQAKQSTLVSSRKRKRIDYTALNKGDNDNDDDTDDKSETPLAKKRKTRIKIADDSEDEDTETEEKTSQRKKSQTVKTEENKSESKTKPKQSKIDLKCSRCEENCVSKVNLKRHMALKHQALWTEENPEGLEDYRSLNQVIKIKKFLNCIKCDKQLNFLQYYKQHLEWCGRETETFTCPICNHSGLLARWQDMHIKTCERNRRQQEEAKKKAEILEQEDKEQKAGLKDGEKKKRRAAKAATTMLHNLSQDKDGLDHNGDLDDDMVDKDFEATASDNEEVPEEYEEDEEEPEAEEEYVSASEEESDVEDSVLKGRARCGTRITLDGKKINTYFYKYHFTYSRIKQLVNEQMSKQLYPDLLPYEHDWKPVIERECEGYLPAPCYSIHFTFYKRNKQLQRLKLYESASVHGFPLFFTGLSVWKMAWCPSLTEEGAIQYLAVVGKTSHHSDVLVHTRVTSPGLIQIWDTGITNNSEEPSSLPKLVCNIIHDYGSATDIKWCPSGCRQTGTSETDEDSKVLSRLGLLACSFTDSTVRIFSIPNLSHSTAGSVPTYRPSPVITLVPHKSWQSCSITCSCLDWQSLHGHTQIVAGYSDGTVRAFNLLTTSRLQLLKPTPQRVLLPFHSFQAHQGLITSCAWLFMYKDCVITAGEDSNVHFWDLKDVSQPINTEGTAFMPLRVTNNLVFPGAITSAEDNYSLNTNRTRFVELANLRFFEENKGTVYGTSHSASTWDITYSNWLNFMLACDSRGTVEGTAWYDITHLENDSKSYVQRVKLFETKVKFRNPEDLQVTSYTKCQCKTDQSESCNKCVNQSEAVCDSQSEHLSQGNSDIIQSDKSLQSAKSNSQSENLSQKLDSSGNQSDNLKQTNGGDQSKKVFKRGNKKLAGFKRKASHLVLKSLRTDEKRKEPKTYSEIIETNYLEFTEYLTEKTRKRGLTTDTEFDVYDRFFINSLHAISVNPNQHCCFWVAYGGEAGLVRLVNIHPLLPGKFKTFYESNS